MGDLTLRRPAFLSLLLLGACGDPPATSEGTSSSGSSSGGEGPTTGSTGVTTGTVPTTGDASQGSSSGGSDESTGSSGAVSGSSGDTGSSTGPGSSSSSGGEVCETRLCGDMQVCCAADESCLNGACVATCAQFDALEVDPVWSWTSNEVTVVPLVADLQGDAAAELVVNTMRVDGVTREVGELVLLGADGTELWRINHDPDKQRFGSHGASTPVVAELSGDGKLDIVYFGRPDAQKLGNIHAVDGAGKLLWTGHDANDMPVKVRWDLGAAAAVNLDDDPQAEIAVGGALFDHDGLMVWNEQGKSGLLGTPTDNQQPPKYLYSGGLPTFADLTGDGAPELITGREAWSIAWTPGDPPVVTMTQLWQNKDGKGNDGWPAVADLDQNGTPEVVLVAWPDIKVLDGATGKLWCGVDPTGVMCEGNDALRSKPIAIKGSNLGGPATIADFDGDGRPEAALAGGVAFAVYDFNREGEEIVKPMADPSPAAGAMYVRWSSVTQDNSSASTGAAAFDFQGDGAVELAYQDECRVRVYDGRTGATLVDLINSSGTVHEYPLVIDLEGDGAGELVVVANILEPGVLAACQQKTPDYMMRKGVFVYRGADPWVSTGSRWPQHTYHVTNVGPDGNVPAMEVDNWATPGLNNFRQGEQNGCK
jgi:hypothetical protein